MSSLQFEWDDGKAASNRRKHGVSFDEASTVFADESALLIADPEHSKSEDRFVLLGLSESARILVVVHAFREDENTVRIISARRANARERDQYLERWNP
ncbi:MAG: BrnT family toxin [Phycisphaerales bacterium]